MLVSLLRQTTYSGVCTVVVALAFVERLQTLQLLLLPLCKHGSAAAARPEKLLLAGLRLASLL
jgi:hypothetical protein